MQEQQVFITKITFKEVQEVEGGKILLFSREYSNGAKDLEAQTPVIKNEDFERYIQLHIESFEKSINENQDLLKKVEENIIAAHKHSNTQIEFLSNVLNEKSI